MARGSRWGRLNRMSREIGAIQTARREGEHERFVGWLRSLSDEAFLSVTRGTAPEDRALYAWIGERMQEQMESGFTSEPPPPWFQPREPDRTRALAWIAARDPEFVERVAQSNARTMERAREMGFEG